MTETIPEIDIELLLGDLPDMPCESLTHNDHGLYGYWHDDGPAKFYVQISHDCTNRKSGDIYAACATYSMRIANLKSQASIFCVTCQTFMTPFEWGRVLGPVR